jgi:hypothetical protein
MATQASATFSFNSGQGLSWRNGFVQFYFGLPLYGCYLRYFIPVYHKYKVYTAYEYLEKKVWFKTRSAILLFKEEVELD